MTAGGMTVSIGPAFGASPDSGSSPAAGATMQDLENAFNLLKVGPDERITIVKMLYQSSAISAELVVE